MQVSVYVDSQWKHCFIHFQHFNRKYKAELKMRWQVLLDAQTHKANDRHTSDQEPSRSNAAIHSYPKPQVGRDRRIIIHGLRHMTTRSKPSKEWIAEI